MSRIYEKEIRGRIEARISLAETTDRVPKQFLPEIRWIELPLPEKLIPGKLESWLLMIVIASSIGTFFFMSSAMGVIMYLVGTVIVLSIMTYRRVEHWIDNVGKAVKAAIDNEPVFVVPVDHFELGQNGDRTVYYRDQQGIMTSAHFTVDQYYWLPERGEPEMHFRWTELHVPAAASSIWGYLELSRQHRFDAILALGSKVGLRHPV